ncbi:TlpA family protein disulfide reductase [Solitalea lacus]|uniref:TlpA family protein disulfide reductase n=1 Tax=Solitalea lacus TaxID=2911172 RepID=UPI001EDB450F|nr:TlpA disulfide reductase family protein [Solitalea lacus]UKJ08822.1 TlpA family protein disulfide reductase [Solitalea lacus]
MKKNIFLTFFVLISFASLGQQKSVITGKITNPQAGISEIKFKYLYDFRNFRKNADAKIYKVDEKGNFKIEENLSELVFVQFEYGDWGNTLLLEPGANATMSFDSKSKDKDKLYKINGRGAVGCQFLEAIFYSDTTISKSKDFSKAFTKIDELGKQAQEGLNTKYSKVLSSAAITHLKEELYYFTYLTKLQLITKDRENINQIYSGKAPEYVVEFIKDLPFKDAKLNNFGFYLLYNNGLHLRFALEQEDYNVRQYNVINKVLPPVLAEKESVSVINRLIENGDFLIADKLIKDLSQRFPASDNQKSFDEKIAETKKLLFNLAPGKNAPAFILKNLNGKEVSLSDFKDKVIYLDFWASWCGPCRGEMPYAKRIKEKYKDNKDVVFLYVSIDEKEDAWKKGIEENKIEGVHLISNGFFSDVPKKYMVNGIPRYYLIGKGGEIISNEAPRPSSEEQLTTMIDKALKN